LDEENADEEDAEMEGEKRVSSIGFIRLRFDWGREGINGVAVAVLLRVC